MQQVSATMYAPHLTSPLSTYHVFVQFRGVLVTERRFHHCCHRFGSPAPHALVWVLTHLKGHSSKVTEVVMLSFLFKIIK